MLVGFFIVFFSPSWFYIVNLGAKPLWRSRKPSAAGKTLNICLYDYYNNNKKTINWNR